MIKYSDITLFDLILTLSEAVDLVNPAVAKHNLQVANIAYRISEELNLPAGIKNDIVFSGALHDIGALSIKEKLNALEYEVSNPHHHAESGYNLLKNFKPLGDIAELVRFHHVPWNNGAGVNFNGADVPKASHMLHLADRIAVLINRKEEILAQKDLICNIITKDIGTIFNPEYAEGFIKIARKEFFWIEAMNPDADSMGLTGLNTEKIQLDIDSLTNVAKIFSKIIDFRSKHTVTHSSGVASVSEALAAIYGFSERECSLMKIAGYLHDLGKLSVSDEILDKPGPLSQNETNVMRKHTFYTYHLIRKIGSIDQITDWAAYHHERLDGSGYPFHLKARDIPIGSRIMAVADIYTALSEDRPYRPGLSRADALAMINEMVGTALDIKIVKILNDNIDDIEKIKTQAQAETFREYKEFI